MKAILPKSGVSNASNLGNEKETIDRYQAVTIHKGKILSVVDARFYMGRAASASVVYCSVWINKPGEKSFYTSGRGSAGGWGYHKQSAAFQSALQSAGITLQGNPYKLEKKESTVLCSIAGCGDTSIRETMIAICRALGFRGPVTIL